MATGPESKSPRAKSRGRKESLIAGSILHVINATPGCYAYKTHGDAYAHAGQPDIIGSLRGRAVAIEVKRPGLNPTPIQAVMLERWRRAGATAAVVRSIDDARDVMRAAGITDIGVPPPEPPSLPVGWPSHKARRKSPEVGA